MANKDQVIANFAQQTGKYTHGSRGREGSYNLWYSGRILYSFGTHFPLAIRYHSGAEIPEGSEGFGCGVQYIVNGDKYSATTTQHQNQAIKSLKPNVQIPFSALENAWNYGLERDVYYKEWGEWHTREEALEDAKAAGKSIWDEWGSIQNPLWVNRANALAQALLRGDSGFKIVRYRKDTWEYSFKLDGKEDQWSPYYQGLDIPEEFELRNQYGDGCRSAHRLGAVLFTIRGTSFLSSFDEQDRSNYFLCQVPGSPTTIEEAYENLVPDAVKALPSREGVLRQGDWFFIPVSEDKDTLRSIRKAAPYITNTNTSAYRLGGATGTHVVTRARRTADGLLVVQGCVRHDPQGFGRRPEHRRLKIGDGKQWYIPVKNTSEAGWGAVGNVD